MTTERRGAVPLAVVLLLGLWSACGAPEDSAPAGAAAAGSGASGGGSGAAGLPRKAGSPAGVGGGATAGSWGTSGAAGKGGSGQAGSGMTAGVAGTGGAAGDAGGAAGAGGFPCKKSKPAAIPPDWVEIDLNPCVGTWVPGPSTIQPKGTWEPCNSPPGLPGPWTCFHHPWATWPRQTNVFTDGQSPTRLSIVFPWGGGPLDEAAAAVSGIVEEDGTLSRVLAQQTLSSGIPTHFGPVYASSTRDLRLVYFYDSPAEHQGYFTWYGGPDGKPPIHDTFFKTGYFSASFWASESWIIRYQEDGILVSPWEPGNWQWIYKKSEPGPKSRASPGAGEGVLIERGDQIDLWTQKTGRVPLILPTGDGIVERVGSDGKTIVWTDRRVWLNPQVPPEGPTEPVQAYMTNDMYMAPYATDAATIEKTKKRVRKEKINYPDFGRWVVTGGYAVSVGNPWTMLVRLSDGAAWFSQYQPDLPEGMYDLGVGVSGGYFYARVVYPGKVGEGGGELLARLPLAELPPPVPAD